MNLFIYSVITGTLSRRCRERARKNSASNGQRFRFCCRPLPLNADLVLIPSHRHLVSIETLAAVRDLLNGAGNPPAFVVYNEIHPSATASIVDLKAGTAELCGLPACPVHLCDREASYGDATDTGQAPQEIDRTGHTAAEIAAGVANTTISSALRRSFQFAAFACGSMSIRTTVKPALTA
jgi:hypothetical protein